MAQDERCGKCAGCTSTPRKRPCILWWRAAAARIKRELESSEFAKVLRDFDNRHED